MKKNLYNEIMELFEQAAEMEVDPKESIMDLELDSLIIIDLRNKIEYLYHVDLKMNHLITMTVDEACNFIIKQINENVNSDNSEKKLLITDPNKNFPLNDLQRAYWVGRSNEYELGNVSTHVYVEFENEDLDYNKLNYALEKVIERQEMLRAVILSSGKQKIIPIENATYIIPYKDLSEIAPKEKSAILENERQRMSHQIFEIDSWPFFAMQVFKTERNRYRIYFSIDMLIADACSLHIFFRDLNKFYCGDDSSLKPIEFNFRDYIANDVKTESSDKYIESNKYWDRKCQLLAPAPNLPINKKPSEILQPKFRHIQRVISKENYGLLKERAKKFNVTIPAVLLAAYGEVLSYWCNEKRISINVTNLDRKIYHESVTEIMGQFASFTIISTERCVSKNFFEHVAEIQKELWQDLDNRYIGGTKILQKIRALSGNMGNAIMPVVFTCILEDTSQTEWLGEIVYSISQTSQIWLDNQTLEKNGELVLSWDYLDELFPKNMPEQMLETYEHIILGLISSEYPERLPESLFAKRRKSNLTENPEMLRMPSELLSKSFKSNGERICIVSNENRFTYNDVDIMTDKIASEIAERKLTHSVVAVIMEKSWQQAVSVLGIVKSGCAYLPIDSQLPDNRIAFMLENSGAKLVITDEENYSKLLETAGADKIVKCTDIMKNAYKKVGFAADINSDDLMYIIYTSGSTGKPSGVMVHHGGVGNAIADTNKKFDITCDDVVIAMTPLHHDMSVYDIFGIIAAGGKLVIPNDKTRKDPALLADLMLKEQVTIWNSVPALMDIFAEYIALKPYKLPSFLRLVFLGGDWISKDTCKQLFSLICGLKIVSVGGPTETTLWNICYPFTEVNDAQKHIPYGRPLSNTKYYIVDDDLNEVPDWVTGNICSSGVGTAAGYCSDTEKTEKSFITDPKSGERLFISGDLGRYTDDGVIEICGRKDFQLKINGVRIELEEIESVIRSSEGVHNCAVACDEKNRKKLVAYVEPEHSEFNTKKLEQSLKKQLPSYMLPKDIVIVEEIPYNANHKIDRSKLSKLRSDTPKTEKAVQASETNTQTISEIVKNVLDIDEIGGDDNIALCGASSIELIKIINQLETVYHHRMALEDFFDNLIVNKLAEYFGNKVVHSQSENIEEKTDNKLDTLINCYDVIFDRHQREIFKMSNNGLRRDLTDNPSVQLEKTAIEGRLAELFSKRRSYRNYDKKQISFADLSGLLFSLANSDDTKYPNFLYASGGGLYSVQVYVYIKKNAVENLEHGFYYYDRNSHKLRLLNAGIVVEKDIHWSSNQEIYADSGFSIYLVSDYDAVGPMYGNQGVHFVTIEAGLMSEILELKAPEYNIGLCQIGNMDFDKVKPYLDLKPSHIFMHTLIGGYIDYSSDYESKQQTREYMNYEYESGAKSKEKDMIQAVNVQTLKPMLDRYDDIMEVK